MVARLTCCFPQLKPLFRVFPTHRRLEARVEKLKGERNACGKSLVNMQRTLAENARHVDQVCAQGTLQTVPSPRLVLGCPNPC